MEVHELKEFLEHTFTLNNKVLDEKFNNIELQLDNIVKQTTKTNGRVNILEAQMANVGSISDKYTEYHVLKCPVKQDLATFKDKVSNDLFILSFIMRYPKFSAVVAALLILLLVAGGLENVKLLFGL